MVESKTIFLSKLELQEIKVVRIILSSEVQFSKIDRFQVRISTAKLRVGHRWLSKNHSTNMAQKLL